jgi:hypothetical protein
MKKVLALAALAACYGPAAHAAFYSFDMSVQTVAITGYFEIDDSSPNYVGGGTTNEFDLLDYSFTLSTGGSTVTLTPAQIFFVQTFNITYAPDLLSVTQWDMSLAWDTTSSPGTELAFAGNSSSSGFFQIADFLDGTFDAFASPPPLLTSVLIDDPNPAAVPLPAGLPLLAGALGLPALMRRRRGNRVL